MYLTPLVGLHSFALLGPVLLRGLAHGGEPEPAWRAANIALALVAQLGLGLTLGWMLRGAWYRCLLLVPVIPALVSGLNGAYPYGFLRIF